MVCGVCLGDDAAVAVWGLPCALVALVVLLSYVLCAVSVWAVVCQMISPCVLRVM